MRDLCIESDAQACTGSQEHAIHERIRGLVKPWPQDSSALGTVDLAAHRCQENASKHVAKSCRPHGVWENPGYFCAPARLDGSQRGLGSISLCANEIST